MFKVSAWHITILDVAIKPQIIQENYWPKGQPSAEVLSVILGFIIEH